jgi:hypothetical protein
MHRLIKSIEIFIKLKISDFFFGFNRESYGLRKSVTEIRVVN